MNRLALLAVAVLAGCGASGTSNDDARAEVEQMIRSQLPDSLRRNTGQAVLVSK